MARVANAAPPAGRDAAGDTVPVIGVHRAELAFGDAVVERLGIGGPRVLRIPAGIAAPRTAPGESFRSRIAHREMYLQLRQEIGPGPRLLLDLHCALDESRRGADIFCGDAAFLDRLRPRLERVGIAADIRLVAITGDGDAGESARAARHDTAHTWIPPDVWAAERPRYVGIELYQSAEGAGVPGDWTLAAQLIAAIIDTDAGRPSPT